MDSRLVKYTWVLQGDNLGEITSHFGFWLHILTSQVDLKLSLIVVHCIVKYYCGLPACTMVSLLTPLVKGAGTIITVLFDTICASPLDWSIWVSSPEWMGSMLLTTNASYVHDLGSNSTCGWTIVFVFLLLTQGCVCLALCRSEIVTTQSLSLPPSKARLQMASTICNPPTLPNLLPKTWVSISSIWLDGTIGVVDMCSTYCVSWLVGKYGVEGMVSFNLFDKGPLIA